MLPSNPDALIESLLQPFVQQSGPVRSIVTVDVPGAFTTGDDKEAVLRLGTGENGCPAIVARERIDCGEHSHSLSGLARQAHERSGWVSGNDLLVLPAHVLNERITPVAEELGFRAVTALFPHASGEVTDDNWKLRRSLFDRGLVCIGSAFVGGCKALSFLASDTIQSLSQL